MLINIEVNNNVEIRSLNDLFILGRLQEAGSIKVNKSEIARELGVSCFKADKPNVLEASDYEIQRLDLDNVDNRKNLILYLTGFTNVTAWAKLYSTKFIREHNLRFIEDVYYEDTHFSMLCVLLAKKYCKVQSALYYYFENTGGIIRSEISNAKIRDAKIIMDHIRQAIQSRKAELGNVIEQCYCEIQTFLLWHQYIEPYGRIETFMNRELDICKEEFLKSEPDIFNNPYVKFFSDDVVLKRMSRLRVSAKKMNNVCFLDNAIHICLGIHDKDGNYSVWAGTTMQSIVENTKAPIVFHILHDDTLNEINKNKLSFIADNSGNDIEFHHFNADVFGTFADSMNRFTIGTMFRIMLPSSPTEVASPLSLSIAASAWNTSAHHLKHSLKLGAPTGIIMNS